MDYVIASVLDQASLSVGKNPDNGIITFALGGGAYSAISQAVQKDGVAKGNTKWNVYSTVLGTLIGKYYWNEEIESKSLVGIALCAAGLYLLS